MLGLLVPILITVYVYKQAKDTGRNPILWSVINVAVIVGVQILIGVAAGILIGLGIAFYGLSETAFEDYSLPISLIAGVASLVCSYFLVVRRVNQIPDEEFNRQSPPPPPQFN
jgi:diacylglycerol kinase